MEDPEKAKLFEDTTAKKQCSPKSVCNWILGDISKRMNEKMLPLSEINISAESLSELLALIESGKISNATGKIVFEEMLVSDKMPSIIVKEKGFIQISDEGQLETIVQDVLKNNQKSVEDYHNGKTNALGFLVGQCMKATKGQGNPAKMKEILLKLIG